MCVLPRIGQAFRDATPSHYSRASELAVGGLVGGTFSRGLLCAALLTWAAG